MWDPIECRLILYLVYVLHWPDGSYFTAEICSHVVTDISSMRWYTYAVLDGKIHVFAAAQRDGHYQKRIYIY